MLGKASVGCGAGIWGRMGMGSIEREGKPCGVAGALQGRSGDAEGDAAPSPTHFSPPFIIVKGRAAPQCGILGQNRKLWGEPGCASNPGQGTASWSPRAAGWQLWASPTHPKSSAGRAGEGQNIPVRIGGWKSYKKKTWEMLGGCSPPREHPQTPKPSLTCAPRPPSAPPPWPRCHCGVWPSPSPGGCCCCCSSAPFSPGRCLGEGFWQGRY